MASDLERARRFLRAVWARQTEGNTDGLHAYLSWKAADGSWHDQPQAVVDGRVRLRLPQQDNLYFAPGLFTEQRRLKKVAAHGRWLYADLDEVDPSTLSDLPPTLAWETSPGRYQALWLLKRALPPRALSRLNQKLTYFTGADRNGWSLTKVLRVPGTLSTKHGEPFLVHITEQNRASYDPRHVMELVRDVRTPAEPQNARKLSLPGSSAAQLMRKHRAKLPTRAKKLLTTRTVTADEDRSARLWELECLLLEAGLPPEHVYVMVQATAWNKWAGTNREQATLWAEVQKAAANVTPPTSPTSSSLPETDNSDTPFEPIRLARYLGKMHPQPSWLVEGVWELNSPGMWQGDVKTYKSTILSDLAVSVASGHPFLNTFEVHQPGKVLMVQEENGPGFMTDRLHRIMCAKGFGPKYHGRRNGGSVRINFGADLDIELLNMKRFNLTDESHLRWLDSYIAEQGFRLVILDPLYRLAPGKNEKEPMDMDPITNIIQTISYERQVAIPLVHHWKKPTEFTANLRAAHRASGTLSLARWWASAAFTERAGAETDYTVRFHTEHRELPPSPLYNLRFDMPKDDPNAYAVEVTKIDKDDPPTTVKDKTKAAKPKRIWIEDVVRRTGRDSRRIRQTLEAAGYTITRARRDGRLRLLATKGE